jgi:hypothetical protein
VAVVLMNSRRLYWLMVCSFGLRESIGDYVAIR